MFLIIREIGEIFFKTGISGGQPKVTFNGQVFEQLSNTPTLTEAGFIYGTNANEVAAGTGSTIVAVNSTTTSNTPNSISLLNSFLGQQGTAGQTPRNCNCGI